MKNCVATLFFQLWEFPEFSDLLDAPGFPVTVLLATGFSVTSST